MSHSPFTAWNAPEVRLHGCALKQKIALCEIFSEREHCSRNPFNKFHPVWLTQAAKEKRFSRTLFIVSEIIAVRATRKQEG